MTRHGILFLILLAFFGRSLEGSDRLLAASFSEQKAQGQIGQGVGADVAPKLADLEVHYLGLTSAGTVIYQVVNKGAQSTEKPFVVEIYVNGARRDMIRHEPLPAMTMQAVQSNLARFSQCQGGIVRVLLDTQDTVRESNEKNNEGSAKLALPCPKAP